MQLAQAARETGPLFFACMEMPVVHIRDAAKPAGPVELSGLPVRIWMMPLAFLPLIAMTLLSVPCPVPEQVAIWR